MPVPQAMNVAVSAAIVINCYLLPVALPSNAQPNPMPAMESSLVVSAFQFDAEDEFATGSAGCKPGDRRQQDPEGLMCLPVGHIHWPQFYAGCAA